MPIDVLMPQLSPTMTEGRLAKWTRAVGDKISAGDVIAEVETDKATMEIEASDDGIIHAIIGEVGADLPVGAPIAVLRGKDETVAADYKPTSKAKSPSAATGDAVATASGDMAVEKPASTQAHETVASVPVVSTGILPKINLAGGSVQAVPVGHVAAPGERVKASPLAKRLAGQRGVDLSGVAGTGPHGRIVADDVVKAPVGGGARAIVRRPDSVTKLTPMRKAIASRLLASKQTVPHFYLSTSVRMDRLMDMRQQMNDRLSAFGVRPSGGADAPKVKLSVNDFIVKACAMGLRDYPAANAAWNGDSVVSFGNVDISVAVSIDGGLITPVVANADQKELVKISAEVKQLAADARAGKLKPEQYEGGSFSLSNLGMYGVEDFAAIINPPQAAILAVGVTQETVLVEDGEMFPAQVMKMTLSVDHRVIDGALGAELLGAIKEYLENPITLIM